MERACKCAKCTVNSEVLVLKPANFLPTSAQFARTDCLCKLVAAPLLSVVGPLDGDDRTLREEGRWIVGVY